VVASNRGSLPEVVGDAALLLDADDVDAWTEGLNRVLSDNVFADDLRRAGYDQARRFSWDKAADQTLAVYRSG
jgi:glycosyltransferase involved in cell wall biosynthesis